MNQESAQYIALSSITYAYKAKNFLQKAGVKSYIVKTPAELTTCGCGYSVKIQGDSDAWAEELRKVGIKVTAVYK